MLKRLKKNYFFLVSVFLILYFFFNLVSGQRGLISYFDKKKSLEGLQQEESLMINQIKDLDLKNSLGLKELSMGMSSDYIEAIEHGSTFVRIGSKIFGNRT